MISPILRARRPPEAARTRRRAGSCEAVPEIRSGGSSARTASLAAARREVDRRRVPTDVSSAPRAGPALVGPLDLLQHARRRAHAQAPAPAHRHHLTETVRDERRHFDDRPVARVGRTYGPRGYETSPTIRTGAMLASALKPCSHQHLERPFAAAVDGPLRRAKRGDRRSARRAERASRSRAGRRRTPRDPARRPAGARSCAIPRRGRPRGSPPTSPGYRSAIQPTTKNVPVMPAASSSSSSSRVVCSTRLGSCGQVSGRSAGTPQM